MKLSMTARKDIINTLTTGQHTSLDKLAPLTKPYKYLYDLYSLLKESVICATIYNVKYDDRYLNSVMVIKTKAGLKWSVKDINACKRIDRDFNAIDGIEFNTDDDYPLILTAMLKEVLNPVVKNIQLDKLVAAYKTALLQGVKNLYETTHDSLPRHISDMTLCNVFGKNFARDLRLGINFIIKPNDYKLTSNEGVICIDRVKEQWGSEVFDYPSLTIKNSENIEEGVLPEVYWTDGRDRYNYEYTAEQFLYVVLQSLELGLFELPFEDPKPIATPKQDIMKMLSNINLEVAKALESGLGEGEIDKVVIDELKASMAILNDIVY